MSWDVRTCSSTDELRTAMGPVLHYWGRTTPADEYVKSLSRILPVHRMHAAWAARRVVGCAGAFPFELTVPGGRCRAAGITLVGVLPTHRRQGILTAMMRAQLDAARERNEAIAYLWATEELIYDRFGYGIASLTGEIELARERSAYHAAFERSGPARIVPLTEAEAFVAPVWERVAAETPGMFARTSEWWQARALSDPPWRRLNGGDMQCVVIEQGSAVAAYALYRLNAAFDRGMQTGSVDVIEAMGHTPEGTRAIWRYLFDIDWFPRVRAYILPLDHPLFLLLAEPRRLHFSIGDGLWVRLVDVGAALSARSYAMAGSIVIDVRDGFCPWNDGRWRVGSDSVKLTNDQPELRCDVTTLGSAYLGGFTWAQLARALRVEELRPGAIAHADALFRIDRAPWCPEIF